MFSLETRRVIMCTKDNKDAMNLAIDNQLAVFNHVADIDELQGLFVSGRINSENTVIWQTPIGRTHAKYLRLSLLAKEYDIPVVQKEPFECYANLVHPTGVLQ